MNRRTLILSAGILAVSLTAAAVLLLLRVPAKDVEVHNSPPAKVWLAEEIIQDPTLGIRLRKDCVDPETWDWKRWQDPRNSEKGGTILRARHRGGKATMDVAYFQAPTGTVRDALEIKRARTGSFPRRTYREVFWFGRSWVEENADYLHSGTARKFMSLATAHKGRIFVIELIADPDEEDAVLGVLEKMAKGMEFY